MIDKLDEMNKEIDNPIHNNAGYVGSILLNIIKEGKGQYNLIHIESILRAMQSRVYLIAKPIEFFGSELTTFYPLPDSEYKPYALWVCMNGKKEAEAELQQMSMSALGNLAALNMCGFLTPVKHDTDLPSL